MCCSQPPTTSNSSNTAEPSQSPQLETADQLSIHSVVSGGSSKQQRRRLTSKLKQQWRKHWPKLRFGSTQQESSASLRSAKSTSQLSSSSLPFNRQDLPSEPSTPYAHPSHAQSDPVFRSRSMSPLSTVSMDVDDSPYQQQQWRRDDASAQSPSRQGPKMVVIHQSNLKNDSASCAGGKGKLLGAADSSEQGVNPSSMDRNSHTKTFAIDPSLVDIDQLPVLLTSKQRFKAAFKKSQEKDTSSLAGFALPLEHANTIDMAALYWRKKFGRSGSESMITDSTRGCKSPPANATKNGLSSFFPTIPLTSKIKTMDPSSVSAPQLQTIQEGAPSPSAGFQHIPLQRFQTIEPHLGGFKASLAYRVQKAQEQQDHLTIHAFDKHARKVLDRLNGLGARLTGRRRRSESGMHSPPSKSPLESMSEEDEYSIHRSSPSITLPASSKEAELLMAQVSMEKLKSERTGKDTLDPDPSRPLRKTGGPSTSLRDLFETTQSPGKIARTSDDSAMESESPSKKAQEPARRRSNRRSRSSARDGSSSTAAGSRGRRSASRADRMES